MQTEEQIRKEAIRQVAERMMIAARTAPKGKGTDNIHISLVDEAGIQKIAGTMKKLVAEEHWPHSFERDAGNILQAPYMVLLATKIAPLRLKICGMCGYENCDEKDKYPGVPCVFNTGDLGIAIGSAVSIAMDNRVDNRVMYTVGQAVKRMKLLPEEYAIIYAIPLSASSKNVFFDR
ncbi:MAG: ferredoxin [Bacteroidales bacterium]|nr:ferredoxin [Bacteroidales bacterium]